MNGNVVRLVRNRSALNLFQIEAMEARTLLAAIVPAGFTDTQIAANLTGPDALDVANDGRVFFTDQSGHVRIVEDDQLVATPFADLSSEVDSTGERGLLGVALDPNFATNRYVYVYYTANTPTSHNRLSRLTADPTNPNVMLPGSEQVLLDFPSIGTAIWHMGGSIQFGPDGKLYISVGDHQQPAESQSLNSVFGKILRVNTDGTIPTDNPFYGQTTGVNRAIWAMGLRNPYTTAFQPGTGRFFLNDVGQDTWEEINDGFAGANYGWPSTEGEFDQNTFPTFSRPLYTYQHINGREAITGGAFYNPTIAKFPAQYVGKYFFLDFGSGEIWSIDPSTKAVIPFASGLVFANGMEVGNNGSIYYLTRGAGANGQPSEGTGEVHKIEYTVNTAPSIVQPPQNKLVSVGQSATFTVSASGTSPMSYQWTRNGVDIPGATASSYTLNSATLLDNAALFRVRVTNVAGNILSAPATLSVTTNAPPVPVISAPLLNATYRGGDVISFSGSATDAEDGTLPLSSMTWRVDFHHHDHLHPFVPPTSGISGSSFTIPTTGETSADVWYRIHLTVTDSIGLQTDVYRDVKPVVSTLTVNTNVPGLQFKLDGQPHIMPFEVDGVAGLQRTIDVPIQQTFNGQTYAFTGWSDGGATSRTLIFADTDKTLTANFTPVAATITPLSDLPFYVTPTNGWGPVEKDRSNGEVGAGDGKVLTLNGQTYTKGFGVHANSDMRFNLNRQYSQFQADIGIDDEAGNSGSVFFQVLVDDVVVYTSPTLTGASATVPITVPVGGGSILRLVVSDAGNGNAFDHADWGNARLTSGVVVAPPPTALLNPPVSYPTGSEAHGIFAGDIDGDGKKDLAVANAGSSTISILLGNGDLTFASAVNYDVGSTPKSVTGKDLNGDGKMDLVTANQGSGTISVLINKGDGTFFPAVDYAGTSGAHEVTLADLDGDNDFDIAEAGWGTNLVRVLFNNGNGIFSGGTNYTIGAAPHSVVAFDFNGDNKPDLAVADHDSGNVAVLLNNGNGTYQPAVFYPVGTGTHSLRAGDVNGDTKLDLVTANDGSANASVLIGIGNGTFAAAVNYATGLVPKGVALGDVNGDGKLDLLTANTAGNYPNSNNPGGDQISVLINNGNGTFAPATSYTTGRTPFSIAIADFDGDGDMDVATANWHTDDVTILRNNTNNRQQPPIGNQPPVAVGDSGTTTVNQPVVIDVVGNDSDPGGSINPATVVISTQPLHGTVSVNPTTGAVTYTPANNYSGPDSFAYTVKDNQGAASAAATVSLTINNPAPPSGSTVYLSDLTPTSSVNGWGLFERDRSNGESGSADGKTITLNGQTYAKGLGIHAASDIRYSLAGGSYTEFRADIGVDDEVGNNGSVVFQVYVDNVLKYTSPTMSGTSTTLSIVVPVTGASALRLVVTDSGNGNTYDHADWASARLVGGAALPAPSAPSNLQAALNGGKVDLSWADTSTTESGFRIERRLGNNGTWNAVQTVAANVKTWSDTSTLAPLSTYFYRVVAFNNGGDSSPSNLQSIVTPVAPAQTWLSDLNWASATNGWGSVEKDRANGEQATGDGAALAIRSNSYTKGLGVHANSDIRFNLNGQYSTFTSDIGLDNETKGNGSVIFQIYVDGLLKYDSGLLRGTDAAKTATVSVTGAQQLRLVVTNGGDGNTFDHADWAGAKLLA